MLQWIPRSSKQNSPRSSSGRTNREGVSANRDTFVFTETSDLRDRQASRAEARLPVDSVSEHIRFSIELGGAFDLDAELKILGFCTIALIRCNSTRSSASTRCRAFNGLCLRPARAEDTARAVAAPRRQNGQSTAHASADVKDRDAHPQARRRCVRGLRQPRHHHEVLVHQGQRQARGRQAGSMGVGDVRHLDPGDGEGHRAEQAHRHRVAGARAAPPPWNGPSRPWRTARRSSESRKQASPATGTSS